MGLRSEDGNTVPTNVRRMLLIICGGTCFAVPAEVVRGIAGEQGEDVPAGLASLAASSAVVDFGELFGVESAPDSPDSRVFVCGTPDGCRAFRVDQLLGMHDVDMQRFRALPAHFTGPERQWFGGLLLSEDGVVLLVNPGWLLGCEAHTGPVSGRLIARGKGDELRGNAASSTEGPDTREPTVTVPIANHFDTVTPLEEASDAEELPWAEL